MYYLFATYTIIFSFTFFYLLLLGKRNRKLSSEVDALKEMIKVLENRS